MYLVVFVVLLSSVLGLYTQVTALQAARFASSQMAIGQMMYKWHGKAYAFVHDTTNNLLWTLASVDANAVSPEGCMLVSSANVTYPNGPTNPCSVQFNDTDANYKWLSILYAPLGAGTQQYLITFVAPPTSAAVKDLVTQPPVGYSVSEIWQQIKNAKQSPTDYGIARVNASAVVEFVTPDAPVYNPGAMVQRVYTLPANNSVPVGSVGFITPL